MTTYQPYIYIVGWIDLNAWYIGCRYASKCHPGDLWSTYFTSSKLVRELRESWGEPDYIETFNANSGKEALAQEADLIRTYNLHSGTRWLNQNIAGGTTTELQRARWNDPEYRQRQCASMRKPKSAIGRENQKAAAQRRRKLTGEQVKSIFHDQRSSLTLKDEYGVSHTLINRIRKAQAYEHITKHL